MWPFLDFINLIQGPVFQEKELRPLENAESTV